MTNTPTMPGANHASVYQTMSINPKQMISLRDRLDIARQDRIEYRGPGADGRQQYEIIGPNGVSKGDFTLTRDPQGSIRYEHETGAATEASITPTADHRPAKLGNFGSPQVGRFRGPLTPARAAAAPGAAIEARVASRPSNGPLSPF